MKRTILLLLVVILATTTVFALTGSGTQGNPYQIATMADLNELSTTSSYWGTSKYIVQTANIDATSTAQINWSAANGVYNGFSPIGYHDSDLAKIFRGKYDGQGYTITNLYINRPGVKHVGLFGVMNAATIKNVRLVNCQVTGMWNVGSLTGGIRNGSTVTNCYSYGGTVTGRQTVGGLVGAIGDSNCKIEQSGATSSVVGTNTGTGAGTVKDIGGLVGYSDYSASSIINSYATGSVTGGANVGGFIGISTKITITNCYSTGQVTGTSAVGGFAGSVSTNRITNSFWDINTSGQSSSAGGTDKTTAQMKTQSTYTNAGWIFPAIWTFVANEYPLQFILPPTNLVATRPAGYIKLTWSASGQICDTNALVGYNIYRNGSKINDATVIGLEFSDVRLQYGVAYSYVVKALYDIGESVACNPVSTTGNALFSGAGTLANPYQIQNITDLNALSANSIYWDKQFYFKQTANIDASSTNSGAGFSPIGNVATKFNGFYDGNNKTISNLYINRPTTDYIGLFGYATGGIISNVGLIANVISGRECIGSLVGSSYGSNTINNSYATGSVSGTDKVGGLVGFYYNSSISNSYVTGSVHGTGDVGGLVGYYYNSSISNSYATGSVTGTGYNFGGLAGRTYIATTTNSFWDTQTTGRTTSAGGGTGKTTAQMQTLSTYTNAGWSFPNTWRFRANDYPHLAWEGLATVLTTPPTNLTATVVNGSINLAWSAPVKQTRDGRALISYKVYRNGSSTPIANVTNTQFRDTNLVHNQAYTYYVKALYDEGESTASNTVNATAIYLILSGAGTVANPYQINNLNDLYILSYNVDYWASGVQIKQTVNIDATATSSWNSGAGFSPIGKEAIKFNGSYNGQGFTISNLYSFRPSTFYIGLFGYATGGNISNVGLVNNVINGSNSSGSLVGYSSGLTINNCYATGTVSVTNNSAGGLVGISESSTISDCYATGTVSGNAHLGGLVGNATSSTINNSYARGNVTGTYVYVGGLVGYAASSTITNSYASGAVNGTDYVGGLVGNLGSLSTITNSYASGAVSGTVSGDVHSVGGLVGSGTPDSTTNSFWDTVTSGQATSYGGAGKTTAQMQTLATYTDWAFPTVWTFVAHDYPHLAWEGYTHQLTTPPTNLAATVVNGSINLTWSAPVKQARDGRAFTNSYNVYRNGSLLSANVANTHFSDTDLEHGQTYSYHVTALYNEGESAASNVEEVTAIDVDLNGEGTATTPYQITSIADLTYLSNNSDLWSSYFIQTADIVFPLPIPTEGEGFIPIGNGTTNFTGSYDGQGFTISNLYINRPTIENLGLFGYIYGATIKNVGLVNNKTIGHWNVGGLVGGAYVVSTISDCYTTGSVTGIESVGNLIGGLDNTSVTNCYATGSVIGSNRYAGGLVGYAGIFYGSTNISNCYATGGIEGVTNVGGLVGYLEGSINNSYAIGAVSGNESVGGLVGHKESGTISNSFWNTETTGQTESDGGGTGKTTADMKNIATYTTPGWDITSNTDAVTNIWKINPLLNNGYPYLTWAEPYVDDTLPVTLTSFMAIQTANNFAQITWTTESESSLAGYNIYRNEIKEEATASRVNFDMIEATNSNLSSSYSFVDEKVLTNTTYYYWLQVNEFDGSANFHGPYQIRINEDYNSEPIVIPTKTALRNVYPNPFNPSTSVSFYLNKAENVKLNVYNIKGQLVTNLTQADFAEGLHSLVWNGQDLRGQACASGIYFFRMETAHNVQMIKGILVK